MCANTAGFFTALIQKRESLPGTHQPYPARSLRESGFKKLSAGERASLVDSLRQRYGIALDAILADRKLSLWRRKQAVWAIPESFLVYLGDFQAVARGMMVAEKKGVQWMPSHEFVSRFGDRFTSGRLTISVPDGERWLRGHDLRKTLSPPAGADYGAVVLVEDELGRPLGRGKVLQKRLRNLLPRRLLY